VQLRDEGMTRSRCDRLRPWPGRVLAGHGLRMVALLVLAVSLSKGAASASAASSLLAWGENNGGQLGLGFHNGPEGCQSVGFCSNVAVPVSGLSGGVTAMAGGSQALALMSNGTVMAWGWNADGQLGDGNRENSDVPLAVPGLSGVTAVAASYGISMALLSNGTVMAWGENGNGQLGDGTTNEYTATPVQVTGLSEVTAIATGGSHALALLKNGTVMAWGANFEGELGDGKSGIEYDSDVPVPVSGLSEVTAIAADGGHSLALLSNGTVMAWGENEYGELGDGTVTNSEVPVRVRGLSEVVAIADGASHNLALLSNGTVMAWGQNDWGQLGDGFAGGYGFNGGPETCGPTTCSTIPVAVSGLSGITAIATGYGQSLALRDDETVWSWGEDFGGQLGNGSSEPGTGVPVQVSGVSGATAIAGGDYFSMAELNGETGQIAGGVTSAATSLAIEGAKVCAMNTNGTGSWRCAVTSAGGQYTLTVHGSGSYDVRFWAPSGSTFLTSEYYPGKLSPGEAIPVEVTAGASTSGIDAQLAEGGSISGTVTTAAKKAPLESVEVCAAESSSNCAVTNARGEYTILGLATGEYQVEFAPAPKGSPSYFPQWYDRKSLSSEGEAVSVVQDNAATGIDAELEERMPLTGQGIAGKVTSASTKSAIKGIEVCAYYTGSEEIEELFGECAETDGRGEYWILGLASGEYVVEFSSSSTSGLDYITRYFNEVSAASGPTPVLVKANSIETSVNAQLEEGGWIAGKVTDVSSKAAVRGVLVCALTRSAEAAACSVTDSGGEYKTPAMPSGEYKVGFDGGRNYVIQYYTGKLSLFEGQAVLVSAGRTTPGIDAAIQASNSIAPENTKPPLVFGVPAVNETLLCANGLWTGSPAPSLTERWLRDGVPISGGSGSTYKVQSADEGHGLACEVTASSPAGEKSEISGAVAIPALSMAPATTISLTSTKTGVSSKPGAKSAASPVTIAASKIAVSNGSVRVRVQCHTTICRGPVELTARVLTKLRGGKRTVSRMEAVVLAKGWLSLAGKGNSASVVLRLTATGKRLLVKVTKSHPLAAELIVSVAGGKTISKAVLVT
jgi:alpha-tubulin suppressor-like RCC1 family protein